MLAPAGVYVPRILRLSVFMSLRLVTANPLEAPERLAFVDAAFERTGHESKLLAELARNNPGFDAGMCLFAERDGVPVGVANFLRRNLMVRGAVLPIALVAPIATLPKERRQGVARYLIEAGFSAGLDRGLRAVMALGGEACLVRLGFQPAFDLHTLSARREDLPAERLSGWRGLTGDDLGRLRELYEHSYRSISGTERRELCAQEWEVSIPASHALIFTEAGESHAYLRFRIRRSIELRECGVSDERGIRAVLTFLRQLLEEHGRARLEAYLPPSHPVARALFERGALAQSSNFGGAAQLAILDWPSLLRDTAKSWQAGLVAAELERASLEIGGETFALFRSGDAVSVEPGGREAVHLWTPPEWGAALLTGQRDTHDLWASDGFKAQSTGLEQNQRLVETWFCPRPSAWSYAPIFEVADA
jgi:predicted N-acetyltransferase YhbS